VVGGWKSTGMRAWGAKKEVGGGEGGKKSIGEGEEGVDRRRG